MCILCNSPHAGVAYLEAEAHARHWMRQARQAMLACAQEATDPVVRRRYARMHKRLVRLARAWNAVEHAREVPHG